MLRIWEVRFKSRTMGVNTHNVYQVKGTNAKEAIENALKIGWYSRNRGYWMHQIISVVLIAET